MGKRYCSVGGERYNRSSPILWMEGEASCSNRYSPRRSQLLLDVLGLPLFGVTSNIVYPWSC